MIKQTVSNFWEGSGFKIMAQEKDAVYRAIELAGFDKNLNYSLPLPGQPPSSFLRCLHPIEDRLIEHDASIFSNWKIDGSLTGQYQFRKSNELLTIINVNRSTVEKALGVDLLYYNHEFNSFVMVQYKTFQKETNSHVYRPDNQFYKDIDRMNQAKRHIENKIASTEKEYRLNADNFYFKFCYETKLGYDNDLLPGMYFPLEHLELLLKSEYSKEADKELE
jgi:hypothetical protein